MWDTVNETISHTVTAPANGDLSIIVSPHGSNKTTVKSKTKKRSSTVKTLMSKSSLSDPVGLGAQVKVVLFCLNCRKGKKDKVVKSVIQESRTMVLHHRVKTINLKTD